MFAVFAVYVPTGHAVQPAEPAEENVPRVHSTHDASLVAPTVLEYFPAAQLEQPVPPDDVEKVPPKHLLQMKGGSKRPENRQHIENVVRIRKHTA